MVPLSYEMQIKFVTLEDILGDQVEFNYVMYNPRLSKLRNEEILKKHTKNVFHITLSDEEVDLLTVYDIHHLQDFIDAYYRVLRKHGKTITKSNSPRYGTSPILLTLR